MNGALGQNVDISRLEEDAEFLKVREWRYTVQRTLLSSPVGKSLRTDVLDMPALDALFTTIEAYPDFAYIKLSKMHKVLRHVELLAEDKVPRDAEFHFRARAKALLDRWHHRVPEAAVEHDERSNVDK
ncbi:hypothetical protein GGX14DRAFT_579347 [Mycena pura]|uniref:TFIIS N-terminal domain-containing protein n=1 Tax=Mycena pura TaxID=153505 RepID=A0AAD6UR14_9AGAR|nr:hypothetical protein GGX14DRAFT_579347 [Mycena pura]